MVDDGPMRSPITPPGHRPRCEAMDDQALAEGWQEWGFYTSPEVAKDPSLSPLRQRRRSRIRRIPVAHFRETQTGIEIVFCSRPLREC
jgi:hypothetical protein